MAVTPEEAVRKRLVDDTDVRALVKQRIYPDIAPEGAVLPYVVMARVDTTHEHHMGGSAGLKHPRIQLDYFARTRSGAEDLAETCRLVLDGFNGTVTIGSESLDIRKCFLKGDNSDFLEPKGGSSFAIRVVSHDYELSVPETIPT